MVLLLVYALLKAKRYKREFLFCALFFFIHIFLVLKIAPMGDEIVSDRYEYLPCLGLFSMVGCAYALTADGAYRLAGRVKTALTILLIICIGAFSVISYQRNGIWKDSFTLRADILRNDPKNFIAYNNQGLEEMERKDYAGAVQNFDKAIEVNPSYIDAYNNRGLVKAELKDYAGAIQNFTKAIELNPDYAYAYNNRGLVKMELKDYAGAIQDFNKAIELNSSYTDAYNNRGIAERLLRGHTGFEKANELKGIESVFPTWSSTGCGERI